MSSTKIAYPNVTEPEEVSNNEIQSNGRKLCLVNGLPEVGVEVNDMISDDVMHIEDNLMEIYDLEMKTCMAS